MKITSLFALFIALFSATAFAAPVSTRWIGSEDPNAAFSHVVQVVRQKTGAQVAENQFLLLESRDLATSRFEYYVQTAQNLPIRGASIRIWKSPATGQAIQVEADVESAGAKLKLPARLAARESRAALTPRLLRFARAQVAALNEAGASEGARGLKRATDEWLQGVAVRTFEFRALHGTHRISVSLDAPFQVMQYAFDEFATADHAERQPPEEFSIPARVFPMFEETYVSHEIQPRIDAPLKYVKTRVRTATGAPYAELRTQRYLEDKLDVVLGETAEGRARGFWAPAYIKRQGQRILNTLPMRYNSFDTATGLILAGRYATINLHPRAAELPGLNFRPERSAQMRMEWIENDDGWEVVPLDTILGKPVRAQTEVYNRQATRLADHDPAKYANDGFDEVQVYYAVTTFMETLQKNGFTDTDLSTRPFNAFLYDTDISMRDNAYYTDDTINFTTYSSAEGNMARDNPTIWHELGHGIMDRLMGDQIALADTGGLSEGMADFLAELVARDVTGTLPYVGQADMRIANRIGFGLTNEVHDDGEAYGGSMKDLLDLAIAREGMLGVKKVTDLTLEAMRLTRNHPGLTAQGWFNHMLFADSLGSPLRAPNELRSLILTALASRNFRFDGGRAARFTVMNGAVDVNDGAPGTRNNPIPVSLPAAGTRRFDLQLSLEGTPEYQFRYPVTVRLELKNGPIQGAIDWVEEAQNPRDFTITGPGQTLTVPLTARGTCERINRPDGSCVDFAYLNVINAGETRPVAKKRFYLRVKTQ